MFTTLISTHDLAQRLGDPRLVVMDCRFELKHPHKGLADYEAGHIAGARYAGLEPDLSAPQTETSGRHPLPTVGAFCASLAQWGIGPETQVVAYDDKTAAWAGRLWWMLRLVGHDAVAVLDGGLAKWVAEGRPVDTAPAVVVPASPFVPAVRTDMQLDVEAIARVMHDAHWRIVDARSPERYRGESEPIDHVAGHLPGALNRPFQLNLAHDGTFRSPDELRAQWLEVLGHVPADRCVCYCGSGVSACHNLLALEHAGLTGAKLYVGSWSEWSRDTTRPIETGTREVREP